MSDSYGIQPVIFNATTIAGIMSQRYDPRIIHSKHASSGSLHQTAHHAMGCAPIFDFETIDLKVLADIVKANADAPYAAFAGAGLAWHEALGSTTAPGYNTGANHRKRTAALGGLVMQSLSWSPGDYARARARGYLLSSDGSTSPISDSSVSLPTQPAYDDGFKLFSGTLAGTSFAGDGCQGLDLNFDNIAENNVAATCRNLDLPYPMALAMAGPHGPVDVYGTIRLQDCALDPATADLVLTFKACANGDFWGTDTVTVTINAEILPLRPSGGGHGQPLVQEILVAGFYDGSNKPVTIATA